MKHKHILLINKVSYPVVSAQRGTATLVSSGSIYGLRHLAEAIRGFDLGWVLLSVRLPVPPRYGVRCLFSVLYL